MPESVSAATGYTLVLPPSWAKIPLRAGTGAALDRILDRSFAGFGRDQVARQRRELRQRLAGLVSSARSQGGLDLYLPVGLMHGMAVPAAFLVSEGAFDPAEASGPERTLAALAAAADGGRVVSVDGAPGVRRERLAQPGPPPVPGADGGTGQAGEPGRPSRRVEYTLAVPGTRERWLVIAFSTIGAGDPDDSVARLLAELFDAVMTTFRWQAGPALSQ